MTLRILIVDDEPLARQRLRTLLADLQGAVPASLVAGGSGVVPAMTALWVDEAAHAAQALQHLRTVPCDLVLLDIHMPGTDGLALAQTLRALPQAPAVVFVTAHADHALQAFELEALDYLTKPVRRERLVQALDKVTRWRQTQAVSVLPSETLLIHDRGGLERIALVEVIYLKAELKYVTVRTARRTCLWEGALQELEVRHAQHFVRIHRNALVARSALRGLEKHTGVTKHTEGEGEEGTDGHEGWWVRLAGVDELLAVSRRQLPTVRTLLQGPQDDQASC